MRVEHGRLPVAAEHYLRVVTDAPGVEPAAALQQFLRGLLVLPEVGRGYAGFDAVEFV